MQRIIELLKLYSIQVLTILAAINTFIAGRDDVPWWFVLAVNVVGVVIGLLVREIPQPKIAAKLAALRKTE